MTALITWLCSSSFGTLSGSLFAWLNKRQEVAELKVKQEFELAKLDKQHNQALALAAEGRLSLREAGEQAVFKAEADAFVVSQQAANQKPKGSKAEFVWAIVRPLITLWLLAATSIVSYRLAGLVGGFDVLPKTEVLDLWRSVIQEMLALTGYAVGWWFGARGSSKRKT